MEEKTEGPPGCTSLAGTLARDWPSPKCCIQIGQSRDRCIARARILNMANYSGTSDESFDKINMQIYVAM